MNIYTFCCWNHIDKQGHQHHHSVELNWEEREEGITQFPSHCVLVKMTSGSPREVRDDLNLLYQLHESSETEHLHDASDKVNVLFTDIKVDGSLGSMAQNFPKGSRNPSRLHGLPFALSPMKVLCPGLDTLSTTWIAELFRTGWLRRNKKIAWGGPDSSSWSQNIPFLMHFAVNPRTPSRTGRG